MGKPLVTDQDIDDAFLDSSKASQWLLAGARRLLSLQRQRLAERLRNHYPLVCTADEAARIVEEAD